jgi:peptidoglycan-associated lipoprotein
MLGHERAVEVKAALEKAGVSPDRIEVTTMGKEQPFCEEHNPACWQSNRRAHIITQMER